MTLVPSLYRLLLLSTHSVPFQYVVFPSSVPSAKSPVSPCGPTKESINSCSVPVFPKLIHTSYAVNPFSPAIP